MKKWEEMDLLEKKESYANYVVREIINSISGDYAVFRNEKKAEEWQRAYNPTTGISFNNLNSLVLDIKQAQGKYQENAWISLRDAEFLGASRDELKDIFENKNLPKAKISYIKTHELQPIFKLDENGQKIPLLDKNGNQRISQRTGEPLYEYEMLPQKTLDGKIKLRDDGQPFMKIATEKIAIEPTLVTEYLFNISEFKTLDRSRLKPINEDLKFNHIMRDNNEISEERKQVGFPALENNADLNKTIKYQIKSYLFAQNSERDFNPQNTQENNQKQDFKKQKSRSR